MSNFHAIPERTKVHSDFIKLNSSSEISFLYRLLTDGFHDLLQYQLGSGSLNLVKFTRQPLRGRGRERLQGGGYQKPDDNAIKYRGGHGAGVVFKSDFALKEFMGTEQHNRKGQHRCRQKNTQHLVRISFFHPLVVLVFKLLNIIRKLDAFLYLLKADPSFGPFFAPVVRHFEQRDKDQIERDADQKKKEPGET